MSEITSFNDFSLNEKLLKNLTENNFLKPTPIQSLAIPHLLKGRDVLALAKTGSGKTGVFCIPLTQKLIKDSNSTAVILSPTRELAAQTFNFMKSLSSNMDFETSLLIGGESIEKQERTLTDKTKVIVATPGRLIDFMKGHELSLKNCETIIFDEVDRLFDMGFKKDIEYIIRGVPDSRQFIMVSATTNMEVMQLAYKYHSEPIEVSVNKDEMLVDKIDHKVAMVSKNEKMPLLVKLLRENDDTYAIIFCNTQIETHVVAEWLVSMDFKAKPISGRLPQNKRTKLMEEFRSKKVKILVCTDVAARGLDIDDITLVINYDIPGEASNYIHRIGRTGRAGKSGLAISFCAFEDCESLENIYELIGSVIPKLDLNEDSFEKNITKRPYVDPKTLRLVERKENMENKNKANDKRSQTRKAPKEEVTLIPLPKYIMSENKEDKKNFYLTSEDINLVKKSALGFYGIQDESLLDVQEFKRGRKKFIFFGPQKITYKVVLKDNYKRLLTPFLVEVIKRAGLRLFVQVSFKDNTIDLNFKGSDERELSRNNNELLNSFTHLARTYLIQKIYLPKSVRIKGSSIDSFKQEKDLLRLTDKLKKIVIESKEPQFLKPLNSQERRLVHQHLDKDKFVTTKSLGEGRLKRIEISLRD